MTQTLDSSKNIAHSVQMPREDGMALWLDAAYQVLVEQGVDKIRISTLAERLTSTRTAFYWYFSSRDELLSKLLAHWQTKNSAALIARIGAYAETINEAIFNMFDCWLDPALFDADLDLAVRNWASGDEAVAEQVHQADEARIQALMDMFERFAYPPEEAYTRAHTIYYTQIGYISMMIEDEPRERVLRMPNYAEVYSGQKPSEAEITRFFARHLEA